MGADHENAKKYHFYQLPRSVRSDHPFIYDVDIAPILKQLRNYGNGQRETLKRLLDEKLAAIQAVEEAGPHFGQCSWIMVREGGNDVTQVQIDLEIYCRTKAVPVAYQRLVREHAERLDLRLAQLRNVDVSFPGRFIGSDRFIQNTDIGRAYAKALEARLGAAQPAIIGELAQTYREKPLSEDPLQTGGAQCQALLGPWYPKFDPIRDPAMSDPLRSGTSGEEAAGGFAQAVSTACKREANASLMRQLPGAIHDVDGREEARKGTVSVFDGPQPQVLKLDDESAEREAILGFLDASRADGIVSDEIGLFVRSRAQLDRARAVALAAAFVPIEPGDVPSAAGASVTIGTMHLAKGLEFKAVVVLACDDGVLLLQERIDTVSDEAELEEVYETERHLIYVASTRARDRLLITGVRPGSEFLDDLDINSM